MAPFSTLDIFFLPSTAAADKAGNIGLAFVLGLKEGFFVAIGIQHFGVIAIAKIAAIDIGQIVTLPCRHFIKRYKFETASASIENSIIIGVEDCCRSRLGARRRSTGRHFDTSGK